MNHPDNVIEILDFNKAVHDAITEYLDSGKADQLILDRLAKLNDRPRCENCVYWDRMTMYCANAKSVHGTMQPSQVCELFAEEYT